MSSTNGVGIAERGHDVIGLAAGAGSSDVHAVEAPQNLGSGAGDLSLGGAGGITSMAPTFSVMCIDDNILLVDALERRLNLEADFSDLYRVDVLSTCVDDAIRLRPSVVLLDIDLPGGVDAMALLDDFVSRAPAARVVVFTGYPTGDLVRRAMARGAWGFVSKGTSSDRLIQAIRSVAGGQAVIEIDD